MKLAITSYGGNDLYAETECTCQDERFADSPVAYLFKGKIKLKGYADSYFFDHVNSVPRNGTCKCGRTYVYQWHRDGVEFYFNDEPITETEAAQ